MEQADKLSIELDRLIINCQAKRTILLQVNAKSSLKKRKIAVIAGCLSIFSAILLSAVVAELLPEKITQLFSVLFAAAGGIAALFSSHQTTDREVANIYTGSSKFLSIRERANYLSTNDNFSSNKVKSTISQLLSEYTDLSEVYDKYLPIETRFHLRSLHYSDLLYDVSAGYRSTHKTTKTLSKE